MQQVLTVVVVAENGRDADAAEREMTRNGIVADTIRVATREALVAALQSRKPDLIVCGTSSPAFDAAAALEVANQLAPGAAFVVVSPGLDDARAVALLGAGADDYVLREHIARLGPAVRTALETRRARGEGAAALHALRESEDRYRRLFELGSDAILVVDNASGAVLEANPAACSLYGYSRDEWLRLNQTDVSAEPDETRRAALQGVTTIPLRWHRTKAGKVFPVEITATYFEWGGRSVQVAAIRDITARRQVSTIEAALRDIFAAAQGTETLAELCGALHGIVRRLMPAEHFHLAVLDPESGLLEFPYFFDERHLVPHPVPPGSGLTGRLLATGRPLLVSGADLLEMERLGEAVRDGGASDQWLGVPLAVSGRVVGAMVLESYAGEQVYTEEHRDLLGSLAIAVAQVIERKRAEQALRDSEAKFRLLFDASNDAIVVHEIGPNGTLGRFLELNEAACRRLGYSREELLRMGPLDVATDDTKALAPEIVRRLQEEGHALWEGLHRTKDGRIVAGEISNHRIEFHGKPAILATVRDLSERRQLEEQIRQAQKMEAIGNLAGGVAHEFNNLLQTMLATVQALRLRRVDGATALAELGGIEEQIRRGAQLTRQLLIFARNEISRRDALDLNEVVAGSGRMLCALLRENIAIALDLADGVVAVRADRGQLEQVLVNLALNAADAMPAGGTLTMRTRRDGGAVWLEVEDTGAGIAPAIRDRIFEPFFTTKPAGLGSGLGLPVVLGIVKAHGGEISVASEAGAGTRFRITLPADGGEVAARPCPAGGPPAGLPRGRGERVLLVEDEGAARQSLAEILAMLGYEVATAANAEDASQLADGQRFDLLLTDMMLPGRSGIDLAADLERRMPWLQVIVMSGYAEEVLRQRVQDSGTRFLQKPFDIETLAAAARRALDGDAAGQRSAAGESRPS